MRSHIEAPASSQHHRSHLVEKNEGSNHAFPWRGQRPPHGKAVAEIAAARNDDDVDNSAR
jgi:hypothetical protein